MTKEELLKENAILAQNNKELGEQNTKLKEDFCRVLGFSYYENDYGARKEKLQIKSWAEIFAEIGKLVAARNFYDFEGNLSELEVKIEGMEQNWNKYFKEKENL